MIDTNIAGFDSYMKNMSRATLNYIQASTQIQQDCIETAKQYQSDCGAFHIPTSAEWKKPYDTSVELGSRLIEISTNLIAKTAKAVKNQATANMAFGNAINSAALAGVIRE